MATNAKHLAEVRAKKGRDFSPKWEGHETWDTNQFLRQFHSAMAWYRLESSAKELKPKVIDWMGRQGCTKEDISAFKKTKDNRCGTTMGAIAACLIKGMPAVREDFNDGKDSSAWLRAEITRVISEGKDDKDDSDVIVEAKKDDVEQGMAQDLVGCEVAAELGGLDVVYGIVTNYVQWNFFCSCNDKVEMEECSLSQTHR